MKSEYTQEQYQLDKYLYEARKTDKTKLNLRELTVLYFEKTGKTITRERVRQRLARYESRYIKIPSHLSAHKRNQAKAKINLNQILPEYPQMVGGLVRAGIRDIEDLKKFADEGFLITTTTKSGVVHQRRIKQIGPKSKNIIQERILCLPSNELSP